MHRAVIVATMFMLGGNAVADPTPRPAVVVPILTDAGAPAYCTRNLSRQLATPMADGGYRVDALRPGRYVVRLTMTDQHVDVLVAVGADGDVVVPPVITRARCHSIELVARTPRPSRASSWAVRYGRSYRAAFGVRADDPRLAWSHR